LTALVEEAERSGYRFVRRLVDEWASGVNRFDRPGEALFAAELGGQVVGVCGLNADPYITAGRVGRVRHLYVLAAHRRAGVGGRLMAAVIAAAPGPFDRLRLRTGDAEAAAFYEGLGFRLCVGEPDCTHDFEL
jgi:GNAT superfamily N-acetyltransferase